MFFLKWNSIPRDQQAIDSTFFQIPNQLVSTDCSFAPIILFLQDHKAETLDRVVSAAQQFIAENPMDNLTFTLATGNAGIEAATNDVIADAQGEMLLWIYGVVVVLIFKTFFETGDPHQKKVRFFLIEWESRDRPSGC